MITTAIDQSIAFNEPEFNEYSSIESEKKPELLINLKEFDSVPYETVRAFLGKVPSRPEANNLNLFLEMKYNITVPEVAQIEFRNEYPMPLFERRLTRKDLFVSLQKWEGYVIEIRSDVIIANLVDLTNQGNQEIAEIPKEEISIPDLDLLQIGAVFYWNIGYKDNNSGQRERISIIRFRRLPMWTKKEVKDARETGRRILEELKWD